MVTEFGGKQVFYEKENYNVRHCTEEDIMKEEYESGNLYICMPVEQLKMFNNFDNITSISI